VAVLITRGAGLTGAGVARALLERGENVVSFDISTNKDRPKEKGKNLLQIRGDVSNWPEVLNVVKGHKVQTIFHLAAILTVASEANPWACVKMSALGAFHVLEAARLFGVQKILPRPDAMVILKNIPRRIKGDRAEEEWGWKPSYSLQETVKDFIEELKSKRV